jgi:stage II sporulation protein R
MSRLQAGIAKQIIRFHVRANSDSEEDQNLKLLVKDKVVTYMQPLLAESKSIEESRQILSVHTEDIRQLAINTLRSAGSDYDVSVYFEQSYFPMKSYGDFTFPPGVYEAFRVDIGKSEGKNWWCVLYPPLCFVDATYGVLPETSKSTLKNILTDDEYNAITESQYKYRFKYLTFLNDIMEKIEK